jgi:hypothetical protein
MFVNIEELDKKDIGAGLKISKKEGKRGSASSLPRRRSSGFLFAFGLDGLPRAILSLQTSDLLMLPSK